MSLEKLAELSRHFGADPGYVLAGGGNTSFKDAETLYIKPSGVRLAEIKPGDFVRVNRVLARRVFELSPPADASEREALVKNTLDLAVCPGSKGRPSVETPLHEVMDTAYVFHLHPAMVNGMTCGVNGKKECARLFPEALWVEYVDPGYTLSVAVKAAIDEHAARHGGTQPRVIFLANHGVFVGGGTVEEILAAYQAIMDTLAEFYQERGVSTEIETGTVNLRDIYDCPPRLRAALGAEGRRMTVLSMEPFPVAEGPLTPDHVVYAKSFPLIDNNPGAAAFEEFSGRHGFSPLVVSVPGRAVFCAGASYESALTVAKLARDAALVRQLADAFGGANYLDEPQWRFIENWEVESYCRKVAGGAAAGRLDGRVAVVTGAAQGFGLGIAEGLAREGALVFIADMNGEGAAAAADKICSEQGRRAAFSVKVNIANEESVQAMFREVVMRCGGLDLLVANAGVLRAGSVKTFSREDWDFVTNINYTGYFLCVKHAAPIMAVQNGVDGGHCDIVQVNSKSGLEGSNRNAAYAASKFGTIGQTQSFALELIDDRIKVNSVCPGNYYDGPLWSDPANGLFTQYLASGKVPGAKTVAEVRKFYEDKVPMRRGCLPVDVVRAIVYAVEQQYETGQAIPVTGGQVMLN